MRILLLVALVPLLVLGCSSGDSGTDPDPGNDSFTASIDGEAWSADSPIQGALLGNFFSIGGTADGITLGIAVTVDGTGTYDLTVGNANGSVNEGSFSWFTHGAGGSGTITFASLGASAAAGTFSFDAGPISNSGNGIRSVTNGSFDFTY